MTAQQPVYLNALHQSPPFDQVPIQILRDLSDQGRIRYLTYQKGEVIHFQSERCEQMEVILKGAVAVQNIDRDGNLFVIQDLYARDLLGANLIFSSRNIYPMTTQAKQETVLAAISTENIYKLCREQEPFLKGLLQAVSDRMLVLTSTIQRMAHKTIRSLILDFIRYEIALQHTLTIRIPMQKKELAERFGIDRTSLSRELARLRDEGLIVFNAQTITVTQSGQDQIYSEQ